MVIRNNLEKNKIIKTKIIIKDKKLTINKILNWLINWLKIKNKRKIWGSIKLYKIIKILKLKYIKKI